MKGKVTGARLDRHFAGDKLQQKHMHASNYGHNGVPSVSRDAATFNKQGPCLHPCLLRIVEAEL
jgi:hypothetical protein